jgi:mannose-6-phosphate isomerase-like protein (cupin superfamily)
VEKIHELRSDQLRQEIQIVRRTVAAKSHSRNERLSVQNREATGDFVWRDHNNTDETFIVLEGTLRIDFRDGAVHISTGEMFVVPKGVEHKPYAEREVKLLLIEPRGVLNTGHEGGDRTAQNDVWI